MFAVIDLRTDTVTLITNKPVLDAGHPTYLALKPVAQLNIPVNY